tara:strand:+ start:478 stop:1227 length:750 start_codon:yes stop_codon:yes gene_type:complete
MSNQKVESVTVTAIKSIIVMSEGYHGAEINKRDKLANAMGFVWSDKSGKYVKGGKAILRRVDLTDEGDLAKFRALKTGFVLANSERLGARYNGYTLAEIFALDKDEKAAIKLKLCNGNKKATATKAQKAKVAAFVKAVNAASNVISSGIANMRVTFDTVICPTPTKTVGKDQKAPKINTAGGIDSKVGDVSNDNEIESGSHTEADSILPPAIRDPRLTTLFNQVAQLTIEDQAAFYEVAVKALADTLTK